MAEQEGQPTRSGTSVGAGLRPAPTKRPDPSFADLMREQVSRVYRDYTWPGKIIWTTTALVLACVVAYGVLGLIARLFD
jgi:hypothetical protein